MNQEYFNIIQALCRCALVDASDATRHQIMRLKIKFDRDGMAEESATIERLLINEYDPMKGQKIERSEPVMQARSCRRCGHLKCLCHVPLEAF